VKFALGMDIPVGYEDALATYITHREVIIDKLEAIANRTVRFYCAFYVSISGSMSIPIQLLNSNHTWITVNDLGNADEFMNMFGRTHMLTP